MTEDLGKQISERADVLDRVRRMLIERLNVSRQPDEIDPDTPLFGTGIALDSIDGVELVVSLQDVFGVRLGDDILARAEMRTVNSLVDYVLARRTAYAGA